MREEINPAILDIIFEEVNFLAFRLLKICK